MGEKLKSLEAMVQLLQVEIQNLKGRIAKLEHLPETPAIQRQKTMSIGEFLRSLKPKDDVEKALFVAFYLEQVRNYSSFTANDVESTLREAKEPPPENVNDKIYRNIKKSLIMESKGLKDNRKAWTLTNTGIELVEKEMKERIQ